MALSKWPASQSDLLQIVETAISIINIAKTRSFPGADIGSDHDLVMMNFRLRLKKIVKPKQVRVKFDLQKLKDPKIPEAFQTMIGWKMCASYNPRGRKRRLRDIDQQVQQCND